jgi:hypothetical protein
MSLWLGSTKEYTLIFLFVGSGKNRIFMILVITANARSDLPQLADEIAAV